ncbi:MAG: S41 family peptidase [Bacteroidota bacterium]
MKKMLLISTLFLLAGTFISCEKDDLSVPEELQVNNFVWKGMNLYYLWQADVPNLADDRFANQDQLNGFLANYSNPSVLFNSLRTDTSIDRFSVVFSDYTVLEGLLTGNTTDTGMDYGLKYKTGSTTDIFGWVRYILPNSDAATKNIHRGDIFYAINGTPLTASNYQSLLANTTFTVNLANYDNGNITPNGQSVTLTKTAITENPVFTTNIINQGANKIGYLMYNGFYTAYESQLNTAFAQLQSQGITHLVLDLRYNSGGSVATATRLASMITGQFNGQIFAQQQWNAKLQANLNQTNPSSLFNYFTTTLSNGNAINSLNLSKVYILTSRSTASASELVINGLDPHINVVQIGDKTTGKNVGSVTLYDSPNFGNQNRNPNHKYAMQPIVLKIANSAGFSDYQTGLVADYLFLEDYGNLGVLGDPTEPLFAQALTVISNGGRVSQQNNVKVFEHVADSKSIEPLRSEMYVELK